MTTIDWKWYGSPGHFICSHNCRFHLCTRVGKYLVSTVGEHWPDSVVRRINASIYDPRWLNDNGHLKGDYFDDAYMKRFGYTEIGADRKYETMVFKAGKECDSKRCNCGVPQHASSELDFEAYNNSSNATEGHMKLCKKWEQVQLKKQKRRKK